jgi:enediyne biosynthesis protein CalE5
MSRTIGPPVAVATLDERRRRMHGLWTAVTPSWAEHADAIDARACGLTEAMLAAVSPGDRVLELACGPGGLGVAAAPVVGPTGEVVLTDVVPAMASIAAERAAAAGLGNVSARTLDLEDIAEPDGSYDVVLCREGLMFAAEPARAVAEIVRVVRPGGRVGISVWGARDRNPWLGLVFDAASEQLGTPVPPPGMPGPFAIAGDGQLRALMVEAGLAEVAVREVAVPLATASFEEWWGRTSSLAGPLSALLASLPPDAGRAVQERARQAAARYEAPDGLRFPGVALLATGRRPSLRS